jgi:hypothetical protein
MPSPSISEDSRYNASDIKYPNSNSVSVAKPSTSLSASSRRAALRPMCPGYLEVFLEPVSAVLSQRQLSITASHVLLQIWTPLPPPVSMQALGTTDDIYAYSLPLGDCDLPYALSKTHMSQVNCVKHSVKQLQYVPHDLTIDPEVDGAEREVPCGGASAVDGSSTKPLSHVWELCYLRGTWVPYPQDTCRLLEGKHNAPMLRIFWPDAASIALARFCCRCGAVQVPLLPSRSSCLRRCAAVEEVWIR